MRINPYLRFNDSKCREAMTFYQKILGGELTFQTVGESPMAKEAPAETLDRIMHADLKTGDFELFAADMMRDRATVGDNIAVSINCDSEEEARAIFEGLSEGADIFMPLEKVFWGALFGVLTDKYGIEWMINCDLKGK